MTDYREIIRLQRRKQEPVMKRYLLCKKYQICRDVWMLNMIE